MAMLACLLLAIVCAIRPADPQERKRMRRFR